MACSLGISGNALMSFTQIQIVSSVTHICMQNIKRDLIVGDNYYIRKRYNNNNRKVMIRKRHNT